MRLLQRLMRFNASRYRLRLENSAFAATIPAGALVLDAGAGDAPYRRLFDHARYESTDFEKLDKHYEPSTYVCDLRSIPVEDCRFDFIVFNQVMEHLPEPAAVLTELHRVLKPGGKLIYTAPLFYEEHEQPYDFYRYTQFGVRHLCEGAGFVIERLDWLEGYFGTVAYQLNTSSRYLPWKPRETGLGALGWLLAPLLLLVKPCFAFLAIVFEQIETRSKYTQRGYPKNYVAILVRPADS